MRSCRSGGFSPPYPCGIVEVHGIAWTWALRSLARSGKAGHGQAGRGKAWLGSPRLGMASQGMVKARRGEGGKPQSRFLIGGLWMGEELTDLWREAEQHLRAFKQLARRTVEEAWRAGDALLRIRQQLSHGSWTPALRERGIARSTAHRFIKLRQQYTQMSQVDTFGSFQAGPDLSGGLRPLRIQTEI